MNFPIRTACLADEKAITSLIQQSVRVLALPDYSPAQIEGALQSAWGLDTQLIKDQSYFVVEDLGKIIASGGWSFRKTLFGNNYEAGRDSDPLDPASDYAKIRAFFVHPDYARKGIGSLIMKHCEQAAQNRGFTRLELMSTLPGIALYQYHGFKRGDAIQYKIDEQLAIELVPMVKYL